MKTLRVGVLLTVLVALVVGILADRLDDVADQGEVPARERLPLPVPSKLVGVGEELDQLRLGHRLDVCDRALLEADVRPNVPCDLPDDPLEDRLGNEVVGGPLVVAHLSQDPPTPVVRDAIESVTRKKRESQH